MDEQDTLFCCINKDSDSKKKPNRLFIMCLVWLLCCQVMLRYKADRLDNDHER